MRAYTPLFSKKSPSQGWLFTVLNINKKGVMDSLEFLQDVTIEKAEVIPSEHGEHIAIYFNQAGETVKKQIRPWALLSAIRHYEKEYTSTLEVASQTPDID